jgi:hypothetical protein
VAYEPRRTLLVALSALAVVLVAALFPAAGVGSHPAGSAGVGGPAGPVDVDTPDRTPTPDGDPTPTARDEPTADEQDPTEAPDDEDTPVPDDDDNAGLLAGLSLMGLLVGTLKAMAVGAVGTALVGLIVVLNGAEPGTPHVELPFGYTITLPFAVPEWAGHFGTRVSRLTMGFVVSVSASVTQLLDASAAALAAVTGGLGIVMSEGLRGVGKLLATLPGTMAGALSGLATLPRAALALPATLSTVGSTFAGGSERPGDDAREMAPDPVETDAEPEETGPPSVEDVWTTMVESLPLERAPSTTPAEFAHSAAKRGFPAAPIQRVTRAFEDVVYGGYEPGDRATAARDALSSLRERLGGDA